VHARLPSNIQSLVKCFGRSQPVQLMVGAACCLPDWSLCLVLCCAVLCCLQTVEVLWIHNQQFADWERSLPPKTYERLQKDRGDDPGVHNAGCMKREPFDGQVARLLKEGKTVSTRNKRSQYALVQCNKPVSRHL